MFVGIVTAMMSWMLRSIKQSEDISSKMAAVEPHDKSYFETSVFEHAKHRIIWLLVLMFSATLTGSIITRYENAFQAVPLLVSMVPMLMIREEIASKFAINIEGDCFNEIVLKNF